MTFLGLKRGAELAALYRSADVFVFPSRTDTFGNVMIEALSSGVPVAAYPVSGPIDVLTDPECGAMDDDLGTAVARATDAVAPAGPRLRLDLHLVALRRPVPRRPGAARERVVQSGVERCTSRTTAHLVRATHACDEPYPIQ